MNEIIKLNQLERGLKQENVRADIKAVSGYSKPIFRIRRQMSKLDSDRTFRLNYFSDCFSSIPRNSHNGEFSDLLICLGQSRTYQLLKTQVRWNCR